MIDRTCGRSRSAGGRSASGSGAGPWSRSAAGDRGRWRRSSPAASAPGSASSATRTRYIPNMGRTLGGSGDRRAELPGPHLRRRLGGHPRLDVLPEPQMAQGVDREVSPPDQELDLLGGRPRRHRAPVARPVRGAGPGDQLAHHFHRLRVGQRPHSASCSTRNAPRKTTTSPSIWSTASATTWRPRASGRPFSGPTSCWASPARSRRTPSRPCAC